MENWGNSCYFSHRKQILLLCNGKHLTLLRSPVLKCSPELVFPHRPNWEQEICITGRLGFEVLTESLFIFP